MTTSASPKTVFETVCVVGLGYIGLPTAAFIASRGPRVIGVDVKQSFVDQINAGEVPFFEPDFDVLLKEVVKDGKLSAQTDTPVADAYIVAVPTPFKDDYAVDTKYIQAAAKNIAPQLKGGELIVLESTSPPGTTEKMAEFILAERSDLTMEDGLENSVYFAHAPERVLPGRIMAEMSANDRVIGGVTPRASEMARDLYATFSNGELLVTDAKTAEMAKLTENSFRDVNIAFANELSIISERLGIDVWELIELANHHPRVNILQPGPGVGGHCIAVDPWFIVNAAPEESRLIRTAREVNDGKPVYVLDKVEALAQRFKDPVVAALGIAFKANIDDLRESPSLNIVDKLATDVAGVDVRVVEPNVEELPEQLSRHENVRKQDLEGAIADADIVLLLVDHDSFKTLDQELLKEKVIVDTKGVWR
ncbi:UDP-N-acetyl-D-mannosamine dehydrogenase [Gulosibacter molinativorax]|uniref:UDP-N-acetyl-D-mannosamine dehydrogenase n=1 Tax=Gulosibacter molinativorax TaxID=256821 RepID=A0ABT7C7C3_9MICO|nr:UDP-N-acetyl-D-mannosamine dehydrogenase [Gulosibacter molinativorax]MDJ1370950.1 UDP-N-acetyl-D-mannosamine dehydrogenase [Gulosibacter molinativorax]QUY62740.1 Nucleotide sugar dehydrogenase [Gulosibacter molinativorax]